MRLNLTQCGDFTNREIALPYEVTSAEGDQLTLSVMQGDQDVQVVFRLIESDVMSFKSSASDDMDFYVWKRAETGDDDSSDADSSEESACSDDESGDSDASSEGDSESDVDEG